MREGMRGEKIRNSGETNQSNQYNLYRLSRRTRKPTPSIPPKREIRISGTFELVLRLLRTSSKLAENLFKILGDAHQRKFPLGNRKNSLGQGKNFSWAREIRPNYFTALWNTLLDRHLRF